MGRFSLKDPKRLKATSWYLMERVALHPLSYRCLYAHFKSWKDCEEAKKTVNGRDSMRCLEVWDDIAYTKWFWTLGSGFGDGMYE